MVSRYPAASGTLFQKQPPGSPLHLAVPAEVGDPASWLACRQARARVRASHKAAQPLFSGCGVVAGLLATTSLDARNPTRQARLAAARHVAARSQAHGLPPGSGSLTGEDATPPQPRGALGDRSTPEPTPPTETFGNVSV